MFFEYALDPKLLNNWQSFRYFTGNFGIPKGKLISRYPKHWKRMVYESLNECGGIERKKIEESLKQLDSRSRLIPRPNHQWNKSQDWLINAEAEHLRKPFQAIIASDNPRGNNRVLIGDDLDHDTPLWRAETQVDIARDATTMASSIALLLGVSRVLIFIDPHFGPEKLRYRRPLQAFLETALQNRTIALTRIEYHTQENPSYEYFSQECQKWFPTLIPIGLEVYFKRWCQKQDGDILHDRFILTDIGGVQFTVGLDEGKPGEKTSIQILSNSSYHTTWNKYLSENPVYDFVDEVIVKGTK